MNGQKKRSIVLRANSHSPAPTSSKNSSIIPPDDPFLIEISRCVVCFENFSKVTRVPISVPCGHTFCKVCVSKVVRAKTFHCCVCRVVSIIGFGGLNKNLSLIQFLEHLKLLEDDDGVDNSQFAGSYCASAVSDQVYANLDPAVVDLHSHFYLGLIKGYLRYQLDNETNYLSPAIAEVNETVRKIENTMNSLKQTFTTLREASGNDDLDNFSIQNLTNSPFGTVPEYDIDDLYQGIDFDIMRSRMRPLTVGRDINEVRMAWVPVTNGDLTLFRVYDGSDPYPPDSYSQSGRASIDTHAFRASETTEAADFVPGPFISNSRILPVGRTNNHAPHTPHVPHAPRGNQGSVRRPYGSDQYQNPYIGYYSNTNNNYRDHDNPSSRYRSIWSDQYGNSFPEQHYRPANPRRHFTVANSTLPQPPTLPGLEYLQEQRNMQERNNNYRRNDNNVAPQAPQNNRPAPRFTRPLNR